MYSEEWKVRFAYLCRPLRVGFRPSISRATRSRGTAARHEDFEAYQHGDAGLMWELFDCIKWIKRGRMELAKNYLQKLVRKF